MPSLFSFVFLSMLLFFYSPLSPISAQSSILVCPEGSYYSSSSNQCQLCPPGHYQNYPGRTECTKCPRDMYTDREGASECTRCDTGYYAPDHGSLSCVACKAGHYIDPASAFQRLSLCLPCSPGQWSNEASSSCTNCKAGYYNNKEGSTTCSPCPSNTYSANDGSSQCTPCSSGLFSSEGSSACSADISTNSNTNNGQIGESSMKEGISSLSTNKIIAIVAGSVGGLLILGLIGLLVHRYHQKKVNIEKNRLMIEQTKRSSLNRSSFSQSVNSVETDDGIAVGV